MGKFYPTTTTQAQGFITANTERLAVDVLPTTPTIIGPVSVSTNGMIVWSFATNTAAHNAIDWPVAGYEAQVEVTTAGSNISWNQWRLYRVSADLSVSRTLSGVGTSQTSGTGIVVMTISQGGFWRPSGAQATDRFALSLAFNTSNTMSNNTVAISVNDTDTFFGSTEFSGGVVENTPKSASETNSLAVSEASSIVSSSVQIARPDGTGTVVGTWTGSHLDVDEAVPDDNDYISSSTNPAVEDYYSITLSSLNPPQAGNHIIRFRYAKDATAGRDIALNVQLRQGDGTVITDINVGIITLDTYTQFEYTLTPQEVALITDYEDLRFRFIPTASGGGAGRAARISWLEFETPEGLPPVLASDTASIAVAESNTLGVIFEVAASDTASLAASEIRQINYPGLNNLLPDGDFESGTSALYVANTLLASISWESTYAWSGEKFARVTQNTAGQYYVYSPEVPVKPNTEYTLRFRYRRNSNVSQSPNVSFQTLYGNKNQASFVNPTWSLSNSSRNVWIEAVATVVTQSLAAWLRLAITINQPVGDSQDFDLMEIVEGSSAALGGDPPPTFHTKGTYDPTAILSVSETTNITEIGGVTPISASDTIALSVTESQGIISSDSKTASDGAALGVIESTSFVRNIAASDGLTIILTESSAPFKQIVASDSIALSVTETTASFRTRTATDTASIAVNDIGAAGGSTDAVGADSTSIGVTEQSSIFVTVAANDTAGLGVVETRSQQASLSRTDGGAIGVTETTSRFNSLVANDGGQILVTESSGYLSSDGRGGTETVPLSVTESTSLFKQVAASDSAAVSVSETTGRYNYAPGSETIGLAVTESSGVLVTISSADTSSLIATESSVTHLTQPKAGTDTSSLGVIESTSIFKTIAASDGAALLVTESRAQESRLSRTDAASLSVSETRSQAATLNRSDTLSLALSEAAGTNNNQLGQEPTAISVTETATILVTIARTDTTSLTVNESAEMVLTIEATDAAGISVTEAAVWEQAATILKAYHLGAWRTGVAKIYNNGEWREITFRVYRAGNWT